MSLLSTAERLNTANQLKAWNEQTIASMNQAKQSFTSIATQRVSMEGNIDFSDEDRSEVDGILIALNELAKTLIAPESVITILEPIVEPIV